MNSKVLIAYASKYGATKEIAEKIGEVLRQNGLEADVQSAKEVSLLNPYDTVILGSALYIGRWRKEARKFLKRYEQKLAGREVWIFLSGPTGEKALGDASEAWHLSKKLEASLEKMAPHDVAVFRGALFVDKLNTLETWMIHRVNAPTGDFRDWEAITAWAETIAQRTAERVAA